MWGLCKILIDSLECFEDIYFCFEIFFWEDIWLFYYKVLCERNKVILNLVYYFILFLVKVLEKIISNYVKNFFYW